MVNPSHQMCRLTRIPSSLCPSTSLSITNILFVPCITKNVLSVSKFPHDNNVEFECLVDKCFVKSHVSRVTLLEGFRDPIGLYSFPHLVVATFNMPSMSSSNSIIVCNNGSSISRSVTFSVNNTRSSLLWNFY